MLKHDQKCLIVGTKGTQERVLVKQVNETSWFEPLKCFCVVHYLRSGPSELPNQRGLWSKSNELVLKIGTFVKMVAGNPNSLKQVFSFMIHILFATSPATHC